MQYWSSLCENFGQPIVIASIQTARSVFDAAASMGSGSQNASAIVENYLDVLDKMRARHIGVIPQHDKLDFHQAGTVGANVIKEYIKYLDDEIRLYILGSQLPTQTEGIGSNALGEVQAEQLDDIIASDRGRAEETLTIELLQDIYTRNRFNFMKHGIYEWPGYNAVKLEFHAHAGSKEEMKKAEQQQMEGQNAG